MRTVSGIATAIAVCVATFAPHQLAAAKTSTPPSVRIPHSYNLPWWECEPAWQWLDVKDGSKRKVRDYSVTIRKGGYTEPIGDDICGYMGSGTYRFRVKVYTKKKVTRVKSRPVYKTYPVQVFDSWKWTPMTSFQPYVCDYADGWIPPEQGYTSFVHYNCTITAEPYMRIAGDGVNDREYTSNLNPTPLILWRQSRDDDDNEGDLDQQHIVVINNGQLSDGVQIVGQVKMKYAEVSPVYKTVMKKRVDHHERYKVRVWKRARPLIVTGEVQVNVT